MWPFRKLEKRAASYTDAIVDALLTRATDSDRATALETGAVEIAAGFYQRAFMSASVSPISNRTMALTPELMGSIGRELIRAGEALFFLEVIEGSVMLTPVGSHDVRGSAQKNSWRYRLDLFGPSRHRSTRRVPADGVIHCMYARSPSRPYRGESPLDYARHTGKLAANLENKLAQEAGGPVGNILPIPADPGLSGADDDPMGSLKRELGSMRGRLALVETTSGGWGDRQNAPRGDWEPKRIGMDPPGGMVQLRENAIKTLVEACGVPSVLIDSTSNSASLREGWRMFLHGSLTPLATSVSHELSEKLGTRVSISFDKLFASDISSRSRAYKQFRDAGMEDADARKYAGLTE